MMKMPVNKEEVRVKEVKESERRLQLENENELSQIVDYDDQI